MSASASKPVDPEPGAVDLLEETIGRLRQAPAAAFAQYYGATLPFVLGLLYFWADFSRSADAEGRAPGAALVLTMLFVAMKTGQAAFTDAIRAGAAGLPVAPWTFRRLARTAFVQAAIQPTGLFVLPAAAVATIPLGWALAFYGSASALGTGGEDAGSAWRVVGRAARAAVRRPRQNHTALAILLGLGFFAWLNILAAVFILPHLLRMFTGEENMFTRSGAHLFNTTFFAATFALVYLAVDPLLKAFYALRCFHGDAAVSGADLKAALRALPAPPRAAMAALALLLITGSAAAVAAEKTEKPGAIPPAEFQRSAREVLSRREFAWRLPPTRKKSAAKSPGLGADLWRWIEKTAGQIVEWWRRLFARQPKPARPANFDAAGALRFGAWAGLALTSIGVLWLIVRLRRRAPRELPGAAVAPGVTVDVADESLLADQLPEDEWLALAAQLRERGEYRLALRAYYLSGVASLAAQGLLVVARHKSNGDYQAELSRRAHGLKSEVPGAFARNVRRFERVWYGAHAADDELLARFQVDRAAIAAAVPPAPALPG